MREPEIVLSSLTIFFTALAGALIFSMLLKRLKVPWAVTLILGGVLIGPHGLRLIELNDTLVFLSEMGILFLMFIAGMETKVSAIKSVWKNAVVVGVASGLIPAMVGVVIGLAFGYGLSTALLLGIIFINSSFAVVIPTLESKGILHYKIGRVIVASTMIQDISSLIMLAVFLQIASPEGWLPLPVVVILLGFALAAGIAAKSLIPRFRQLMVELRRIRKLDNDVYALFEQELTLVVAVLVGVAIVFELFKMETVVGAFFTGLILTEITRSKILEHKIHILGYGVFIPIFFVTVGVWIDVHMLTEQALTIWPLILAIVLGSSASKFVSGWLAAKMLGYSSYQSSLIGITSVPQLITTLAIATVGQRLGIMPPELVIAIVVLSITTVVASPLIAGQMLRMKQRSQLR